LFNTNKTKGRESLINFESSKIKVAYQTVNKFNSKWEKWQKKLQKPESASKNLV